MRNCAWCFDPPDEYGSHGICEEHARQLLAKRRARKERELTERRQREGVLRIQGGHVDGRVAC